MGKVLVDMMAKKNRSQENMKLYLYSAVSVHTVHNGDCDKAITLDTWVQQNSATCTDATVLSWLSCRFIRTVITH